MNRKVMTMVAAGAAVATVATPLAACGGGAENGDGDGHRGVTAADMEAWRDQVREAGAAIGEDAEAAAANLVLDCEDTIDTLVDAIERAPDPPYQGGEWRELMDQVVERLRKGDVCEAVEDFDREKLEDIGEQLNRGSGWVADVNRRFPSLDWDPRTYLEPKG